MIELTEAWLRHRPLRCAPSASGLAQCSRPSQGVGRGRSRARASPSISDGSPTRLKPPSGTKPIPTGRTRRPWDRWPSDLRYGEVGITSLKSLGLDDVTEVNILAALNNYNFGFVEDGVH